MRAKKIGVLLMAYGSPSSLNEVEAYLTDIKGGKKPAKDLVEDVKERYRKIGGTSPLLAICQKQAKALQAKLNRYGKRFKVYLGMKHWYPSIEEAISQMVEDGVKIAVGLVLAPHYSQLSVGGYFEKVLAAQKRLGTNIKFQLIKSWWDNPKFLTAVATKIEKTTKDLPKDAKKVALIFTAHSLPARILDSGDPYQEQLLDCCQRLAKLTKVRNWYFAYQSVSKTSEPWLGPDIFKVISNLSKNGMTHIMAVPIGFVSDHLETLYDLDHQTKKFAQKHRIWFTRTESLNTSSDFIEALAEIVKSKILTKH